MTALAMIIGMAPMALSAEQNAPLGRAVIGGLLFATVATLLFVPAVFSIAHRDAERPPDRIAPPTGSFACLRQRTPHAPGTEPRSAAGNLRASVTGCFGLC